MKDKYKYKFRYIKDWTKRQSETFLKPTWFNVQGLRPAPWGGFWQPRSMVSISSVTSKNFLKHRRFWRSPSATSKWWQCQRVWLMYRLLLGQQVLLDSTYYTIQVLLVVIVVKVVVLVVCVPHSYLTPLITPFKSYLSLVIIEEKVVVLVASCMYTQVLLDSTYYNFHRSCSSSGP